MESPELQAFYMIAGYVVFSLGTLAVLAYRWFNRDI